MEVDQTFKTILIIEISRLVVVALLCSVIILSHSEIDVWLT